VPGDCQCVTGPGRGDEEERAGLLKLAVITDRVRLAVLGDAGVGNEAGADARHDHPLVFEERIRVFSLFVNVHLHGRVRGVFWAPER
jgi:hypothetical protein